jgi:hypothetical protein
MGGTVLADRDEYLKKFVGFLATQDIAVDLTYDDVARANARDELGISSLNIILIVVNYIREYADDEVTFDPEWVGRLENVDGILSVLHEIDEIHRAKASL